MVRIYRKSEEKITTTVYNLRLDNEQVYYANNYLVHNGGVTRPISEDVEIGDMTAICELIQFIPMEYLEGFLPEV